MEVKSAANVGEEEAAGSGDLADAQGDLFITDAVDAVFCARSGYLQPR